MKDATRHLIFKTATKIFAKQGYEKTSVDEIAQSAKIAKGTIYYHFTSKEDILFGLIQEGIDDLSEKMQNGISGIDSSKQKMEKIIEIQVDYFYQYRDLCRVLLSELWRLESRWKKSAEKIQEKYISITRNIINEGKKSKEFKKDLDTNASATALFGLVSVASLDWAIFHKDVQRETMLQTIKSLLISGLIQ